MSGRIPVIVFFLAGLLTYGCKHEAAQEGERPLARVYDKYLYPSDIKSLVSTDTKPEDSARIVGDYIDNWIRQNLVLKIASDNLQSRLAEIDKQTEDYRESLIIYAYERQWLLENLDTIVSEDSLETYYTSHPKDFVLKSDIYKLAYVVVPANLPSADSVRYWFTRGLDKNVYQLEYYCARHAYDFSLNTDIWLSENDLFNLLPYDMYEGGRFRTHGVVQFADSTKKYYALIDAFFPSGTVGPFEYFRGDIGDIIVNKRKMELLKKNYQDMYTEGMKRNNAEIYPAQ